MKRFIVVPLLKILKTIIGEYHGSSHEIIDFQKHIERHTKMG